MCIQCHHYCYYYLYVGVLFSHNLIVRFRDFRFCYIASVSGTLFSAAIVLPFLCMVILCFTFVYLLCFLLFNHIYFIILTFGVRVCAVCCMTVFNLLCSIVSPPWLSSGFSLWLWFHFHVVVLWLWLWLLEISLFSNFMKCS